MFTLKSSVYDLRNSQVLNIPNFNSQQYGKDTFRYQGAKLCNTLSNELKNTNSKDSFKKVILTWSGPICHNWSCIALSQL